MISTNGKRPPTNGHAGGRRPNGTFATGTTGNPGGRPKAVRELVELARSHVPASLELAVELRDDETEDSRVRLDAAKFLVAYGLGSPTKFDPTAPDFTDPPDPNEQLTVEELRALARRSLRDELREERELSGDADEDDEPADNEEAPS